MPRAPTPGRLPLDFAVIGCSEAPRSIPAAALQCGRNRSATLPRFRCSPVCCPPVAWDRLDPSDGPMLVQATPCGPAGRGASELLCGLRWLSVYAGGLFGERGTRETIGLLARITTRRPSRGRCPPDRAQRSSGAVRAAREQRR